MVIGNEGKKWYFCFPFLLLCFTSILFLICFLVSIFFRIFAPEKIIT